MASLHQTCTEFISSACTLCSYHRYMLYKTESVDRGWVFVERATTINLDYRIKGNWIVQTDFMFRMQQNTIEKRTNYKTKLNQFNLKGTLYYEF